MLAPSAELPKCSSFWGVCCGVLLARGECGLTLLQWQRRRGSIAQRIFLYVEYLLVKRFVPYNADKALVERILLRFDWIDSIQRRGLLINTFSDGTFREPRPAVTGNQTGLASDYGLGVRLA